MRIFGTIEDAYTEKLLPGAIVTLKVGDTELIEHTPSKDGHFTYDIPDAAIPIEVDILTCTVEKKGYKTQTSTYTIPEGDIELAVELVPNPINWWRVLMTVGIILAVLLLVGLIIFGINYLFFGPGEYPIKSFSIKPTRIDAGSTAEINWETIDADKVFLGEEEVIPEGGKTVKPAETRRYQLIVKDKTGKSLAREWIELKVTPVPPVILSFTATPLEINLWEKSLLEWKTTGAESLYIRGDPENQNYVINPKRVQKERTIIDEDYPEAEKKEPAEKEGELNGSVEVFPLETTTFTLVAVNKVGVKREESVEVKVLEPPEIISFISTHRTIDLGESVILKWETRDAEQVFLNGDRVSPRYSTEVRPGETTTYKLTARNKVGDRHNTVIVLVRCPDEEPPPPTDPPTIHRFHISSTKIAPGEPTVISWVADHADKVYLITKTVAGQIPSLDSSAVTGKEAAADYPELFEFDPLEVKSKIPIEVIAGKPLETGTVKRVKPVDSIQVSPRVTTLYEIRAINPLKQVSWTRSVEVRAGICTVVLYEFENYRGEFMRFTADAATIGSMNNRVSSIKIIGNCGVKAYSIPNFRGTHQEFPRSVPRLRGTWIGNNTISSLKIIAHTGVVK